MRRNPDLAARDSTLDLDRLESDHRQADAAHRRVYQIGQRWLKAGHLGPKDLGKLRRVLNDLAATYAAHIRLEEEHVFVVASRVLTKQQWRAIGKEMQHRRATGSGGGPRPSG